MILLDPSRRWECPSCNRQLKTDRPVTQIPLHPCKEQRGLMVPFVEVHGVELPKHAARHVVVERGDWVGSEHVQTDGEGRPVMAVRTERPDGSYDTHVLAPAATATRS